MRDLYQIFSARCLSLWLGPPPAEWRNPKGEGAILEVFFPIDNALYGLYSRYEFRCEGTISHKFTYLP